MARQFLYKFTQDGKQKDKGYLESFAFDGGENFIVGGNETDYDPIVCAGEADGVGMKKGVEQKDAMPIGKTGQVFTDSLYYKGTDLKLKLNNYLPPMQEELDSTIMALDTWNRET